MQAGEVQSIASLEMAMHDCYLPKIERTAKQIKNRWLPGLQRYLDHMVNSEGLTDQRILMVGKYGGSVIGRINGTIEPGLADIRNGQAHGAPISGIPFGGLIELVRDLIDFAYRGRQSDEESGLYIEPVTWPKEGDCEFDSYPP